MFILYLVIFICIYLFTNIWGGVHANVESCGVVRVWKNSRLLFGRVVLWDAICTKNG